MVNRRGKEFTKYTRNLKYRQEGDGQIHHKASIKVATEKGVHPDLIKAPINAEVMSEEEHRAYHRENGPGGEEFADYLLSLMPRLFD
jgi:hypothetical protein